MARIFKPKSFEKKFERSASWQCTQYDSRVNTKEAHTKTQAHPQMRVIVKARENRMGGLKREKQQQKNKET